MRPRTAGTLAGAILLLGAAGLAVIWALDRAPDAARPAAGAAPAAAPAPPAAVAPATPAPAAPPDPLPEITPPRIRVQPSAASTVDWPRVPIAGKPSDLGRDLARPAFDALDAARSQMDGCFADEHARMERAPAGGEGHEGPAVLVLRLESRDGALDVVGSEVESRGDSSEALVSCARTVLQGWPIAAPAAAAGRRYRLKWVLQ